MGVPTHLKAIVGVFSALFIAAGTRDIFAPGHGLPLPDDDKLIASVFGAPPVGACGKKDIGCVPGRMLFVSQGWGVMIVTIALVKCALIFSHQEGTFLRRNLFIVLGLSDIAFSAMIYSHEGYFNGQGASAMPFVLVMAIEGLALLHDAFMRDRKVKKTK